MAEKNIEELKIWITGASRGIGRAIAQNLAGSGAGLILSAGSQESLKSIASEFASYANVLIFPCDLRNYKEIKGVHKKIRAMTDGVDVLINNAGVTKFVRLSDISLEDFDNINSVNYRGVFLAMKEVLPEMIEKKFGLIINILSVAVREKFLNSSIYSASKAAVHAMDTTLREEVRKDGIKIVDVFPGAVETDIWSEANKQKFGHLMMQPEDVAAAVREVVELNLNNRLMIEELVLRPQNGDL